MGLTMSRLTRCLFLCVGITFISSCASNTKDVKVFSIYNHNKHFSMTKHSFEDGVIRFEAKHLESNPNSNMLIVCCLKLNETTYDDVKTIFGEPSNEIANKDGKTEISYYNNPILKYQLLIFDGNEHLIACVENSEIIAEFGETSEVEE